MLLHTAAVNFHWTESKFDVLDHLASPHTDNFLIEGALFFKKIYPCPGIWRTARNCIADSRTGGLISERVINVEIINRRTFLPGGARAVLCWARGPEGGKLSMLNIRRFSDVRGMLYQKSIYDWRHAVHLARTIALNSLETCNVSGAPSPFT